MSDRGPGRGSFSIAGGRSGPLLAALVIAVVVSACASAGTTTPPGPEATPEPTATPTPRPPTPTPLVVATPGPAPSSWSLLWSDEFDDPAGTPPDPATWARDLGDGSAAGIVGWGNNERQYYTDGTENAATDGEGNLLLTIRRGDGSYDCYYGPCEYTSARLVTRGLREVQYGRVEARIRVPTGFGVWPAFWMLGTDIGEVGWPASGEIDVMEHVGRRPNEILGTLHGPGYSGSSGLSQTVDLGVPVADEFHTFAIEWWSGHIAWFLDGTMYHEASPADVAPNAWVFDHPFYLILNVAVGGNLGGPVGSDLALPQSMAVDYVRVYEGTWP